MPEMRRIMVAMALVVAGSIGCWAADEPDVHVTVTPCAKELRLGDPLFVKAVLHNRGTEPLVFDHPMTASTGGLQLQIRSVHHGTPFEPAPPLHTPDPYGYALEVAPGVSYSAVEVLFSRGSRDLLLGLPGTYEVRAVVRPRGPSGKVQYVSDPIRVDIHDVPADERRAIEAAAPDLSRVVRAYWLRAVDPAALGRVSDLQARLPDSHLRRVLTWTRLLFELREGGDVRYDLRALRSRLDPISLEVTELLEAEFETDWVRLTNVANAPGRLRSFHWDGRNTAAVAWREHQDREAAERPPAP